MDRCAVFIDAGYLYAAGGVISVGEKSRARLRLDIASVVGFLSGQATGACGQDLLRTYWYDGAARGVPTEEHNRAGLVPDVKVRLGRMNSAGQQKGVDALIYRDLMTLARERAMSHAYLFAGDGDLVEGVRAAQDMGTHVTLMHVTRTADQGTSPDLLHEADRRIEFNKSDLSPFFQLIGPSAAASVPSVSPGGTSAPPAAAASTSGLSRAVTDSAAAQYARDWVQRALDNDIQALVAAHPRIPPHLDGPLMHAVETAHGAVSLRENETERKAARAAFWRSLNAAVSPGPAAP
jgi:uncharacterized LabA/DUF88 family protein